MVDTTNLSEPDSSTLRSIKQARPYIFKDGGNRLRQYIDKNTTFEVQKAFALVTFEKCVTVDQMGIIEATKVASKFTGFCGWAMTVFADFFGSISGVKPKNTQEPMQMEVL